MRKSFVTTVKDMRVIFTRFPRWTLKWMAKDLMHGKPVTIITKNKTITIKPKRGGADESGR